MFVVTALVLLASLVFSFPIYLKAVVAPVTGTFSAISRAHYTLLSAEECKVIADYPYSGSNL